MIDLRSDTVTRPSKGMLAAMTAAKVGDDVFQEDPTVNELERKVAAMFNKDKALFCPSGTMTNQIAIKDHTYPGDEVICDRLSHVYHYEGGGIARNSGASVRLLSGDRGRFSAEDLLANINPDDVHHTVSKMVVIENTCNKGGGSYWAIQTIRDIHKVCVKNDLKLHLDGARLFNALTETGESAEDFGEIFDTISICFSKGLGAPVGSVLLGDNEFIKQARRIRKVWGGGMRQVGYLAAAGIYALDQNIVRLTDDHRRARILGETIETLPYVKEIMPVDTNIVIFILKNDVNSENFIRTLAEAGILVISMGYQILRMVTHLDFNDEMLSTVLRVLSQLDI
ncbi:MAG: aminotransferase class I/II-fold pyridoxal phosphate-dependent enzyme [Candidatus Marinimicrobia bacterium]|nr:aminotransferase class I/II-fold pyridoxal phosphate-dependent enzyme [Candidatus Neomarinimicrobiota bacterium]